MNWHDVCCLPSRRLDTLLERSREEAGQRLGQLSCTSLQDPRWDAIRAGGLGRVELPEESGDRGWAETYFVQNGGAPVREVGKVGLLKVIREVALISVLRAQRQRTRGSTRMGRWVSLPAVFVGCIVTFLP